MRLDRAARRFDKMECRDAYTGALAFLGQLSLYDDSKRDSTASERRVISTSSSVSVPPRRVVEAAGTRFILGHRAPDSYRGSVHRVGIMAHEATELVTYQTPGQVCRGEPGIAAWCGRSWVKNSADNGDSSELVPMHDFHFSTSETIPERFILSVGSERHIVRQSRISQMSTRLCLAEQIPEPSLETIMVPTSGTWNPVTETMSGTSVSARVLRLRWQSLYAYRTQTAEDFGLMDQVAIVAKSVVTPKPGATLNFSDGKWQIESVVDGYDVWACRVSRRG